jgi:hypothetical protein
VGKKFTRVEVRDSEKVGATELFRATRSKRYLREFIETSKFRRSRRWRHHSVRRRESKSG